LRITQEQIHVLAMQRNQMPTVTRRLRMCKMTALLAGCASLALFYKAVKYIWYLAHDFAG